MKSFQKPKASKVLSILLITIISLNFTMCKKADKVPYETIESKAIITDLVPTTTVPMKKLKALFEAAMIDSQNPEPHEISNTLLNLETNKNLIDTTINGERYIKMVSWKLNPAWYPEKGKFNDSSRVIWVTAAPILRDSCRSFYSKPNLDANMRLRQLLGLQPFTPETFFLELWVRPQDMFRPAPDNETNDNTSGLNLPSDVTASYRKWFNNTRAFQYNDCKDSLFDQYGYPWTQLGYTYDWSPDSKTNMGLSEFVIKENTEMYVSGKYSNMEYCSSK